MEIKISMRNEEIKRSLEVEIKNGDNRGLFDLIYHFMSGEKKEMRGPEMMIRAGRTVPTDEYLAKHVAEALAHLAAATEKEIVEGAQTDKPPVGIFAAQEAQGPEGAPPEVTEAPKYTTPAFTQEKPNAGALSRYDIMKAEGLLTGPSLYGRWPEIHFQVEEARKHPNPNHEYGLKFDSVGEPMFKAYYRCPCGHKGNRYVYDRSTHCKCHNCETRLKIEYAGQEDKPQDDFGNYYMANKTFEG